ncbi:MAG: tRNA (N(6)-L-threonylcarbamoyladenosine(37)-C(2))-methylthiotransferase MtaB [Mycoplasmatota bacterium]
MKYAVYTLGCKVNTYESNLMIDILNNNGYKEDTKNLSLAIINTCTVTNTAHKKSIKIIKSVIKKNKKAIVIVVGCAPQHKLEEIKAIEGVSIILGNKDKSKIVDYINKYKKTKKQIVKVKSLKKETFENMILNNFNQTRAFVKIQDGCNNFCTYCIIPFARGGVRSKCKTDVIDEIKHLSLTHKEIVLTGIHTGNYGQEFENYNFSKLVKDILRIKNLKRLRISSIEMNEITDDLLQLMQKSDILVDHLHIPLQSGSNDILKLMNRKYSKEQFIGKIDNIRKIRPNISITTDVIVGFPNETEEHFQETINTINEIGFAKLHVFPYSKRDGTKAATMDNQVNDTVKKQRVTQLLQLSSFLENKYQNKFVNSNTKVLVEKYKDGINIGHTSNYLLVHTPGPNLQNEIIDVFITENKIDYLDSECL